MSDQINHPPHYTSHPSGIECIDVTQHMNFCLGNAMKYLWRAGLKGEDPRVDLSKAIWYINQEITRWEKDHARGTTGAAVLPESRQGSDPQGNEPVPGREEEKGPVSGPTDATIWGWDDNHQERVHADQHPSGEVDSNAESVRLNEARKAEVAERLRELERRQRDRYIHDQQKALKSLEAWKLRDKELDGNATE